MPEVASDVTGHLICFTDAGLRPKYVKKIQFGRVRSGKSGFKTATGPFGRGFATICCISIWPPSGVPATYGVNNAFSTNDFRCNRGLDVLVCG